MSHKDARYQELDSVLASLCDDTTDAATIAKLEALAHDDASLDYVLDYLQLDGLLRWEHDDVTCDRLKEPSSLPSSISNSLYPSLSDGFVGAGSLLHSGWPLAYLVATVVVGIGLMVAAITYVSQPNGVKIADRPVPSSQDFNQSPIPSPTATIGRITGMVDCVWQGTGTSDQWSVAGGQNPSLPSPARGSEGGWHLNQDGDPNELPPALTLTLSRERARGPNAPRATIHSLVHLGDTFDLRSGLLEITYDTGAKVILQGPVRYDVESAAGGYLAIGRLTAKLEKGSTNQVQGPRSDLSTGLFAVRTPTAIVTDLGTEFGVEVGNNGATGTLVFLGKVRIEATGSVNNAPRSTETLVAGESAQVRGDHRILCSRNNKATNTEPNRFVRSMPVSSNAGDAYAKLVLSMNPFAYYRMDDWPKAEKKDYYVLVDSAPGGHHGIAHFDNAFGNPKSRGVFGTALDFHGIASSDYAVVPAYPKSNNGSISVSVWIWPIALDEWVGIAANWYNSPRGEETGQFSVGINDHNELTAQIFQANGQKLNIMERGKPLARSVWQHVAFVADGAMLHLYRDGMEVASIPYQGMASGPVHPRLSIGCSSNEDGSGPRPGNAHQWNGRLDDIAVFHHALTPEQVRQLSAKGNEKKR
jgi:hypothetical protein